MGDQITVGSINFAQFAALIETRNTSPKIKNVAKFVPTRLRLSDVSQCPKSAFNNIFGTKSDAYPTLQLGRIEFKFVLSTYKQNVPLPRSPQNKAKISHR